MYQFFISRQGHEWDSDLSKLYKWTWKWTWKPDMQINKNQNSKKIRELTHGEHLNGLFVAVNIISPNSICTWISNENKWK